MPNRSSLSFVPPIQKSLLKQLHTPDSWILDLTEENINQFNALLGTIPKNYQWEYTSADAFQRISAILEPEAERYQYYWKDMLSQIQAYSVMCAWRLADVSRSASWALRRNDVVCAAIMSRAAIETAAAYAWLQTEIRPTLQEIAQGDTLTMIKYVEKKGKETGAIKDLEDKLLRVVFASKEPDAEDFYDPTNIVTIIQQISKNIPEQRAMADNYFALCEVAHPNMLGRSIYITEIRTLSGVGHEARILSSNYGTNASYILRHAVSGLSWSTGTFSLSCIALQKAVQMMLGHLQRVGN
jgi:hypothetical protein